MDVQLGISVHASLGMCISSLKKAGGCDDIIDSIARIQRNLAVRIAQDQPHMWYVFTGQVAQGMFEELSAASEIANKLAEAGGYSTIVIGYMTRDEAELFKKGKA